MMGLKYEDLAELCHTLGEKLSEANEKIGQGDLTGGDLEYVDKLTHAIKSIKTTMAMMDAEESGDDYSGTTRRYYGADNRRSRSGRYSGRGRKRDSMGRYSRDYSGDDGMIEELRMLMHDAPDDRTRSEFQKFINKIEQM